MLGTVYLVMFSIVSKSNLLFNGGLCYGRVGGKMEEDCLVPLHITHIHITVEIIKNAIQLFPLDTSLVVIQM